VTGDPFPRTSLIDDAVLPAAAHLTGPAVDALLGATVDAAGGQLHDARAVHVQYRPGSDLVVRYQATVTWGGAAPVAETLLAATTARGPLPGTVPMVAETDAGTLEVGVWRWPFDPILTGLTAAVTPSSAGELLADVVTGPVRLEVVAYRPTERAVVRVTDATGQPCYLKVVDPRRVEDLVARHHRLRAAGLPVPEILAADAEQGWFAMRALEGDTLRLRLKDARPPWPTAEQYLGLLGSLHGVELPGATPVPGRIADAIGHAAMLATVLPDQRPRIERLTEALRAALPAAEARRGPTIHGDLYEAQLVVGDGNDITGLLDIDDAGPGDPLDDLATVLAHLRYRADLDRDRTDLVGYADALRRGFAAGLEAGVPGLDVTADAADLDLATGSVLVGLATGPFRTQHPDWRQDTRRQLARAEKLVRGRTR
jgi:aminoglycoside phosphotransferase (APT) family kinase protein